MDNKIKELLSSAQADVQRKEQIRKKTEINKILFFQSISTRNRITTRECDYHCQSLFHQWQDNCRANP